MKKAALLIAAFFPSLVFAAPEGYFDFKPDGITLETGDTWVSDGNRFRLFGIQSCLRGTNYTDAHGNKHDCGEASLAVFAAYIKDTHPICAPVVKTDSISYVICYATVGKQRLDLGQVLVSSGYAFAALKSDGLPYYVPYSVAEQMAQQKQAGLWQFKDVQHPSITLSRAANQRAKKAEQ